MIEKIVIAMNVPVEKVFQFMVDYDKHYTEVHKDHIERVVTIKDPNLEHPDVSFYFRQISPIAGREQKIRRQGYPCGDKQVHRHPFLVPSITFVD